MKIIQTSNLHLGRYFPNCGRAGNRLRSTVRNALTAIIDLSFAEKADLVIFAGDTFDSIDISQNLLEFFLAEIKRLDKIPAVILPGSRDHYRDGSFWEEWRVLHPAENLYILTDPEKPYLEIPELSLTIYGQPPVEETSLKNLAKSVRKFGPSKNHIAVIYGTMQNDKTLKNSNYPFALDDLKSSGFNYVALGGQLSFHSYVESGLPAAYSGSPEFLAASSPGSGKALVVNLESPKPKIDIKRIGKIDWKEIDISMSTISNQEDLIARINELASPDTVLHVTLKGLALFEVGMDFAPVIKEVEDNFLHIEISDKTNVLPGNISEVKVQEKTLLGQYLKVMVEKLKDAHGTQKADLEESVKVGYTLLSGKELW